MFGFLRKRRNAARSIEPASTNQSTRLWEFPHMCRDQFFLGVHSVVVEKASLEARRKGYSVTEQSLPDGSIKLNIQLSGGVA
jgi:hypothetical protein